MEEEIIYDKDLEEPCFEMSDCVSTSESNADIFKDSSNESQTRGDSDDSEWNIEDIETLVFDFMIKENDLESQNNDLVSMSPEEKFRELAQNICLFREDRVRPHLIHSNFESQYVAKEFFPNKLKNSFYS